MSNCSGDCPCKDPTAPKYPSGKIFQDNRQRSLMIIGKEGRFPDARYTVLDINTGVKAVYSYPALVRKEQKK